MKHNGFVLTFAIFILFLQNSYLRYLLRYGEAVYKDEQNKIVTLEDIWGAFFKSVFWLFMSPIIIFIAGAGVVKLISNLLSKYRTRRIKIETT